MATRDGVMKSRGEAYAEMEAHADAFLAEIVDSPDVDTNILLTLFGLSREAEVRRQIADELGALQFMSNDSLLGNLRKYIKELRGKIMADMDNQINQTVERIGQLPDAIKLDEVEPDGRYIVKVVCGDCSKSILESVEMSGKELKDSWSQLILTKGFNTPKCKNGCRATYSDFNINSEMRIEAVAQQTLDEIGKE